MFKALGIFIRTLRYLKLRQLVYQLIYHLRFPVSLKLLKKLTRDNTKFNSFDFIETPYSLKTEPYLFNFLNQPVVFGNEIDWNYLGKGKLWNYNLNYFDFICTLEEDQGKIEKIIKSYWNNYETIKAGKEAYPTSLRIMNLIKVFNQYESEKLEFILKNDINKLYQSLEFHLLGNHLLENIFALYFAAHLYPEKKLVEKSLKLLKEQLTEQILEDGGHYERSFMYHQIILGRLLESISLSEANHNEWNIHIIEFLKSKAEKMLGWMITISDGGRIFQRFNDSIEGISPSTLRLIELAQKLRLKPNETKKLSDSGYRILKQQNLLITANVGSITPTYQPGHSHADSLSFTLHLGANSIIVDPGISTYDNNPRRKLERSTQFHNTVNIRKENNNEVWKSFRVGRRARVKIIKDSNNHLVAIHNGFKHLNSLHRRSWEIESSKIIITDDIITKEEKMSELNIHLHPKVEIESILDWGFILNNEIKIFFDSWATVKLKDYCYCEGFNQLKSSKKIVVQFNTRLTTTITYENSFHNR